MSDEVRCGDGLQADEGVLLGYPSARVRDRGLVLGSDARLRSGTVLYVGSVIGNRFATGHHVVIREECEIGDDVSIWSNSVVDYGCRIGDGVKIHANCYLAQYTWIAEGTFLAPGVTFANDLYPGQAASAAVMTGPTIEARAQLGVNSTVLPFVTIGSGAMVGAGAVVTRDVPPGAVALGCPASVVGKVDDLQDINQRIEPLEGRPRRFRHLRGARPAEKAE